MPDRDRPRRPGPMPHQMHTAIEEALGTLESAGLGALNNEDKDRLLLLAVRNTGAMAAQLMNYDKWREQVTSQLTHLGDGIEKIMELQARQGGVIDSFEEWRAEHTLRREERERESTTDSDLPRWARLVPVVGPVFARFADSKRPLSLGLGWAVAFFATLLSWWLFVGGGIEALLNLASP